MVKIWWHRWETRRLTEKTNFKNELPRSKLRGIKTEQFELLTMQFLILFFPSLLLHVFRNALLIAKLPNRVDEIPLGPELPAPKGLLYRQHTHEDLPCRYALDRLRNLPRAIHRNGLNPVSYTHLRAHETDSYLVCRLLLEK